MGLKELSEYINSRLKEHSLAHATFHEGFFEDSIIVSHPDQAEGLGSAITITKVFGWWYLVYEPYRGADATIELQIKANTDGGIDDLHEIVSFANSHTMHETPEDEIANELEPKAEDNGDWVIVDKDKNIALDGETFETGEEASESLDDMKVGAKERNEPNKYDGYYVIEKSKL